MPTDVATTTGSVVTIACRIGERKPLYQHLVIGDDAWLWIDAGIADTPARFLFPYLEASGLEPPARQMAVITHADVDHFGGLAALRARFPGLVTIAHRLDAPWVRSIDAALDERYRMHRPDGIDPDPDRRKQLVERAGPPATVDVEVDGGETLVDCRGRWALLHAPGHTPGHLVLWESDQRVAIIGDAVLSWGVAGGDGALLPPPYFDVAAYRATVDLLAGLGIERLLSSHFPPADGDQAAELLAESAAAVDAIETATASALRDAPAGATLPELCHAVARAVGRWPVASALALSDPLSAHLNALMAAGSVVREHGPRGRSYRWQGA